MSDPKAYFFELPDTGRPEPHKLDEKWYPGVRETWDYATSSRIYDSLTGIRALVIHATAGGSSSGAMSVMKGGNASWHWLVADENEWAHGKLAWACAPEARAAWHVRNSVRHPDLWEGRGKINHWSLGVEVVNRQSNSDAFSDWQVEMTAKIARYAWAKYPNLKYVVSHAMLDPHRRSDPGVNFDWQRFKSLVIDTPMTESMMIDAEMAANVEPVDILDADPRESICGHSPAVISSTLENMAMPTSPPLLPARVGTSPTEPNWRDALEMAEACKLAYSKASVVVPTAAQKWNTSEDNITFFKRKLTEGFMVEAANKTLISFRGTKGIKDWITDLRIRHTKRPYGKFHRGFFKAFGDVEDIVFSALVRARENNKPIWLTGHSLGAALATVCAAQSAFELGPLPIATIHTFGQPLSGDLQCAAYVDANFRDRFFRFVNNKDIITRLPWWNTHVGQRIKFDKNGNVIETRNDGLETMMSDDIMSPSDLEKLQLMMEGVPVGMVDMMQEGQAQEGAISGLIPGAADHSIDAYIELISKQI